MRSVILGFWIIFLSSGIFAQKIAVDHSIMRNYDTPRFKIYSDLHAGYMMFAVNIAETFSKILIQKC